MPITAADVERLRRETPGCAERNHLNNAGAALMPRAVLEAVRDHLELEARIGGYEAADARAEALAGVYAGVAALLGTRARNVALVGSATTAWTQALSSIPFRAGDVVLASEDDYVSNQLALLSVARRSGVRIERVPDAPEGGIDVGALEAAIRRTRPRLVTLTHVPTASGTVHPAEAVGRVCRAAGVWLLLDACQSAGQLAIDVEALGCDFLSATSRKFLRGPRGAGFLFVSDRALEAGLEPLFPDVHGASWTSPDEWRSRPEAVRFETFEAPFAAFHGLGAAVGLARELGLDAIEVRLTGLATRLRERLRERGFAVLDRGGRLAAIVTVAVPGCEPEWLLAALRSRSINASIARRGAALYDFSRKGVDWALRLSPHVYNTEDEVDAAVAAVAELAAPGA